MKKFFVIITSALLLASCGDSDPIDISYQLTASIDLSTMVKGMVGANNEDIYTKDGKEPVLLTYLIYDNSGALVYETNKTLANFFEKTSFTTGLNAGTYTVVAWACIASEGYKPDWEAEDKGSLNTLLLKSNFTSPASPVLGVSKIKLDFNKSQTLDIAMPTVGCFYTILFNYSNSTKAKSILSLGYRDNNYYEVDSGTSYFNTSTGSDYAWAFEYTVDTKYTGIYWGYFILPTDLTVAWGAFDAGDNILNAGQFSFKAEAGKHQIITVNIETGTSSVTPVKSSGFFESSDEHRVFKPQVIDIGKMKAEPAKVSSKLLDSFR